MVTWSVMQEEPSTAIFLLLVCHDGTVTKLTIHYVQAMELFVFAQAPKYLPSLEICLIQTSLEK